ncbi:MAG: ABC transporter permease [Chloroflexi bacterium]|nr:ABC transporter permease [Chloroflexota bacterium]MCL5273999.1 ABC transporter permease [Chloroflexota bacterium]
MPQFLLRRLLQLVFVLFCISFITFMVGHLAPGDPIQAMMGNRRDPRLYEQLRRQYGLDRPWYEQYAGYVTGVLQGDLGKSYRYAGRPVWDLVKQGVPVSASLGLAALALSVLVGVPLGVLASVRANGIFDRASMTLMLTLFAVPSFVIAGLLQSLQVILFQNDLPNLPTSGWGKPENWVMPVLALAAATMGYLARLTRASMIGVLRQDYIRTAWAKGAGARRVYMHHALRNALIPIVTVLGPSVAFVVVGSFVVENVFRVPGIGFVAVQAINTRDYPVIQSVALLLALVVAVMSLITDVLYGILDPRIRTQS